LAVGERYSVVRQQLFKQSLLLSTTSRYAVASAGNLQIKT